MNDHIKGDGGVIGITDNLAALINWITPGPEIARVIDEFENSCGTNMTKSIHHHDQGLWIQVQFVKHVKAVVGTFEELGNPFREDSKELIVLDTKAVLGEIAVASVTTAETIGKSQYEKYVIERLQERSRPFQISSKETVLLFFTRLQQQTFQGFPIKSRLLRATVNCLVECIYLVSQEMVTWMISLDTKIKGLHLHFQTWANLDNVPSQIFLHVLLGWYQLRTTYLKLTQTFWMGQ